MFELPDTFSDERRHPRALFSGDELIPCYWILGGKTLLGQTFKFHQSDA